MRCTTVLGRLATELAQMLFDVEKMPTLQSISPSIIPGDLVAIHWQKKTTEPPTPRPKDIYMNTPLLHGIRSPKDIAHLSIEELEGVAAEMRTAIHAQVSASGGHLAPNLGVIELTLALHYVFDFASDRLLFDVGHQCYPHKLLTGRFESLGQLRTRSGISGFPEPRESAYDQFSVGHAGTAISTAVGMAKGDSINGDAFHPTSKPDGRRVVALVGDASIVNGLAMEGLNNAGTLDRQFLVVLNDNGMSIAQPQGAVAAYLDRVRTSRTFQSAKRKARTVVSHLPGKDLIKDMYHTLGDVAKASLHEDAWFEKFGLVTVGPVDGHDLRGLIEVLIEVRDFDRPLVLHTHTIKGKGFEHCEKDATTFHSPKPFKMQGTSVELASGGRSFTSAFHDAIHDIMLQDPNAVVATSAMPDGTGVNDILKEFPGRVWDTGICEGHAMDMMAGLAKTGQKPFFAVYSTFLQRAFDQAFQEVALQELPVRLCLDRAGLVGGDGAVHHGFCDISMLSILPKAAITAAMDEPSLRAALAFMQQYDEGLSAVRYPRDTVDDRFTDVECPPFKLGCARPLIEHKNPDIAVLGLGTMAMNAIDACELLGGKESEYRINVYDARFAKPIDITLVTSLIEKQIPIVTIEDHGLSGGFGARVLEACNDAGLSTQHVHRLGIPERWIYQDSRVNQLAEVGLDAASIARTISDILDVEPNESDVRPATSMQIPPKTTASTFSKPTTE